MLSRRTFTIVFIIAALGAMVYVAWNAMAHSMTEAGVKRARLSLVSGDAERVRDELQWPLWFNPRHPAALQLTGLSYLRQKNWSAAIEHLERIPESSPLHADSQLNLAGALLADRQFERAEDVLRRDLRHPPGSIMANRLLSGLYLAELRQQDAVEVLEQLVQYQADKSVPVDDALLILRDLSTAEFHPPLPSECLPTLKDALERDPHQTTVRLAVGQCFWDAGDVTGAEPLMREALQQRPNDFHIRFVVSEFLLQVGDADAAASALSGSENHPIDLDGHDHKDLEKHHRYWTVMSRIAEHRGDFAQALLDQDRAAALQTENKEALARRGRLLQRLDQSDAASDALARSHERASAELDLWNLSREVGARMPTRTECETVARLYQSLGKPHQSTAWQRLGNLLK